MNCGKDCSHSSKCLCDVNCNGENCEETDLSITKTKVTLVIPRWVFDSEREDAKEWGAVVFDNIWNRINK
jgi:hypothetical protein